MKKLFCLLVASALLLTGCKVDTPGNWYTEHIYIDKETGVNYIWINTDHGTAMSPRYNADGSLYMEK